MRFIDYLKDKILIILLNISALFCLDIFLILVNNSLNTIVIISSVWIIVLTLYMLIEYYRRNKFFKRIDDTLDELDKKYLISELMEDSYRLEDKKYKNIIRRSNKSVIERINQLEDEQKDYKDYIESWGHEIKLPITTMELICENNKNEVTRKLQAELSRIDNFVEIVLYYARLDKVYKDYIIKEIDLSDVVYETISKNKTYFIQNKMMIDVNCTHTVFSDKKWLVFIINQILINSTKYKREPVGKISIYTEAVKDGVKLYIEDNGIGIEKSEINRIFDKGFTGTNGRQNKKSTGIGLYLCKKLCRKLGIEIYAESEINKYTKIILLFPKDDYLSKL